MGGREMSETAIVADLLTTF